MQEVREAIDRVEPLLDNSGDVRTDVMDRVCDLLIFAYERKLPVADIVENAAAHFIATYLEGDEALAEDETANEWLNQQLFPWDGDWPQAILRHAKVLSGRNVDSIEIPEYGT